MRCSFLVLLLPFLLHAEDRLVGGPLVVNVGPRAATVAWVYETGRVKLKSPDGKSDKTGPLLRVEKTSFTGLQAGTTYQFTSRGKGAGAFRTAPTGNVPFEFVVFGDTRTRHDVHRKVVDAILKHSQPEFVVHTGDLVSDGMDSSMWPIFFDIERDLLKKVAYYPALGNHERNNRQFYEFFNVTSPYYSFNWGTAHFAVLNSDIGNATLSSVERAAYWKEQMTWLEEDLKRAETAAFRFVVAHHPPMTAMSKRVDGIREIAALVPVFEKYKVAAGFFGHDHAYQHFLQNGIHYIATGGGGAPLYVMDKPPEAITVKVLSAEHFVRVRYDGKVMRLDAIGMDGATIDAFVIGQ